MAISGFSKLSSVCRSLADTSVERRRDSGLARVLSKLLMSAPEMNAFRPAPRMTTTLMAGSAAYASMTVCASSYMPGERALSLLGLSQISQPIGPLCSAPTSPDVRFIVGACLCCRQFHPCGHDSTIRTRRERCGPAEASWLCADYVGYQMDFGMIQSVHA